MRLFSSSRSASMLWQDLATAGLVQGDMPADTLAESSAGDASPWFVKAMLGVAAWLSSLLFLAFLVLAMSSLFSEAWVRGITGLIVCALSAVAFFRGRHGVFVDQLLFILAMLGQLLVLSAFIEDFDRHAAAWWVAAAFEIVALVAIRYTPSRFLSAVAALGCLYEGAILMGGAGLFMPVMFALLTAASFMQWRAPRLLWCVVLALSLVPMLMVSADTIGLASWYYRGGRDGWALPFWVSRVGMVLVWLMMVFVLLRQVTQSSLAPFSLSYVLVWLLALLLAAGTWPVPLALFSLAVLLLGFAQQSRLLFGIGIVQLLWSLGHYYYALQDTLLLKSLSLSLLGAALLLCYAVSAVLRRSSGESQRMGGV